VRRCGLGLAMAAALMLAVLVVVASGSAETRQKLPAGSGNNDDHSAILSRLSNIIDQPGSWPVHADAVVVKRCGDVDAPPPCYTSIQAALDDAPQEAEEDKYIMHVFSCVYEETINITRRNVMLISDGVGATVIIGNKSNAIGVPMNMTMTVSEYSGDRYFTVVELSGMHTVNQNY
jgi:pectin methylesterase-like acyl-CoA thioesterase